MTCMNASLSPAGNRPPFCPEPLSLSALWRLTRYEYLVLEGADHPPFTYGPLKRSTSVRWTCICKWRTIHHVRPTCRPTSAVKEVSRHTSTRSSCSRCISHKHHTDQATRTDKGDNGRDWGKTGNRFSSRSNPDGNGYWLLTVCHSLDHIQFWGRAFLYGGVKDSIVCLQTRTRAWVLKMF